MACFEEMPQQTFEQYSLPIWRSREPTHWMKQTRSGAWPVDGVTNVPVFSMRSASTSVITSSNS